MHRRLCPPIIVVLAAASLVASCDDPPTGPGVTVATIVVTPPTVSFAALGEEQLLSAQATDGDGEAVTGVVFAWTSLDTTVARVNGTGRVVSVATGSAIVTATVSPSSPVGAGSTAQGQTSVTVEQVAASLAIQLAAGELLEGDTTRLTVQAADANGNPIPGIAVDPGTLTWATSDPSIAAIDAQGLLTGIAMGPVTISVSSPTSTTSSTASFLAAALDDSTDVNVHVTFTALEVGAFHSCGITAAERAYCWGSNGEGRLGSMSPTDSAPRNRHVPVRGDRAYQSVRAGDSHTCALDTTGAGYCWGKNDWGQLGGGSSNIGANVDPALVTGGLAFAALDIGWRNSCGITDAGALYCWGLGTSGRLATGDTVAVSTPAAAMTSVSFVDLTLGEHHGCAISADSLLYCWGDNSSGQLGVTTGATCNDIFANVTACETSPTLVSASLRFVSVSSGRSHTCGVAADGTAYCWGDGADGKLGTGNTAPAATPTAVAGTVTFRSVSAGIAHTCGVATDDTVYCWGSNIVGQIGDGTMTDRSSPVALTLGDPFQSVTSGASHTCGLTVDNVAHCWGFNRSGQLGDGMNVNSTTPVLVLGQQ